MPKQRPMPKKQPVSAQLRMGNPSATVQPIFGRHLQTNPWLTFGPATVPSGNTSTASSNGAPFSGAPENDFDPAAPLATHPGYEQGVRLGSGRIVLGGSAYGDRVKELRRRLLRRARRYSAESAVHRLFQMNWTVYYGVRAPSFDELSRLDTDDALLWRMLRTSFHAYSSRFDREKRSYKDGNLRLLYAGLAVLCASDLEGFHELMELLDCTEHPLITPLGAETLITYSTSAKPSIGTFLSKSRKRAQILADVPPDELVDRLMVLRGYDVRRASEHDILRITLKAMFAGDDYSPRPFEGTRIYSVHDGTRLVGVLGIDPLTGATQHTPYKSNEMQLIMSCIRRKAAYLRRERRELAELSALTEEPHISF